MHKITEIIAKSTPSRLYNFLKEHGPADYYQILTHLSPTRVETINKAVHKLFKYGLIEELQENDLVKLTTTQ